MLNVNRALAKSDR